MTELDDVVRENQLACSPIVRSGQAEVELYEHHPELAALADRARQTKIDYMALQSHLQEDEARDLKASKTGIADAKSLSLKARSSSSELLFEMDDDVETPRNEKALKSHSQLKLDPHEQADDSWHSASPQSSFAAEGSWLDRRGKTISQGSPNPASNSASGLGLASLEISQDTHDATEVPAPTDFQSTNEAALSSPWRNPSLSTTKLSMKEIMTQASEKRQSNISTAISQAGSSPAAIKSSPAVRLSQKERKRQQQLQQQNKSIETLSTSSSMPTKPQKPNMSPWQVPSIGPKVSLKDVFQSSEEKSPSPATSEVRSSPSPALTLRQTVPGNAPTTRKSSSGQMVPQSPGTPQQRSVSYPSPSGTGRPPSAYGSNLPAAGGSSPLTTPRSIRHTSTPAEPSLQLSMADILAQQQTEKEIIKEAVAKRSLQEIQEEQAFQEWWNQEEAATRARMEEEAAATAKVASGSGGRDSGRGGRGRKSRGKGRGGERVGRVRGRGGSTEGRNGEDGQGETLPGPSRGREKRRAT